MQKYLDRMPRRLYWTLVNFVKMVGFITSVLAVVAVITAIIFYSTEYYGSPVPFIIALIIGGIAWVSFIISKFDVEREKEKKDRVERTLKEGIR